MLVADGGLEVAFGPVDLIGVTAQTVVSVVDNLGQHAESILFSNHFSYCSRLLLHCPTTLIRATIYRWLKMGDRVSEAPSISLQRHMKLKVVDELAKIEGRSPFARQNISLSSITVGMTHMLDS